MGRNRYNNGAPLIVERELYKVLDVKEEDGQWFVRVDSPTARNLHFFANRFELATATPRDSLVVRKIKLMEQRFKTNQERKNVTA
jgi:phage anti-repressor protein